MRCQRNPHHNLQGKTKQLDLFALSAVAGTVQMPEWRTLPAETRQALTTLMARLILEHADGDHRPQWEGARHDV